MSREINRNLSTIVDKKHGILTEANYAFVSKRVVRSRDEIISKRFFFMVGA